MPRPGFFPIFACVIVQVLCWIDPMETSGGVNLFTNFDYSSGSSEILDKGTGATTNARFSQFRQLYNLDVSNAVTSNVFFRGGGIFDLDDQTAKTDGLKSEAQIRTVRPFIELELNNPLYTVSTGYRNSEIRNSGSGIDTVKNLSEEYTALLSWRPVDLPRFNVNYLLSNVSNEPKTVETREDTIRFDTTYERKGLSLYYSYTYDENMNKLTDFTTVGRVQYGRAGYSRGFFDRRLSMNTFYTVSRTTTEFSGTGSGIFPVPRSAGLFSLNNVPGGGPALNSDPALIDGNLTASSGIDIGTSGDQATLANIGVDLGFSREVDTVYIWVDRSLPAAISGSFSWDIYTSPDNGNDSTWTLQATVFPAPFGRFQNRFEIAFPAVESRFIKVVTRALNPAIVGASAFQHIFVTEMETLASIAGQEGSKSSSLSHDYTLGLNWRFSDRTTVGYNLSYALNETEPDSTTRSALSNGINVYHIFGNVLSGGMRLQRSDRKEIAAESVVYNYTASLRAAYMPAFSQNLSFAGIVQEDNTGTGRTNSISLINIMQLYSGWYANLNASYSRNEPSDGSRTDSSMARIMTNIVPNDKISFNLNYSVTYSKKSASGGESRTRSQLMDFNAYITPTKNLSFFSRINVIRQDNSSRMFQNHTASWSPFQDGALQFSFSYNETFRTEENTTDKAIGPSARLDINRRIFLETSYSVVNSDSDIREVDSRVFSSNVKVLF